MENSEQLRKSSANSSKKLKHSRKQVKVGFTRACRRYANNLEKEIIMRFYTNHPQVGNKSALFLMKSFES